MACEWIFNDLQDYWPDLTFSEKKSVVIAYRKKKKILKGEKYIYQFLNDYGDHWVYRAIPKIHAICLRLRVYENL